MRKLLNIFVIVGLVIIGFIFSSTKIFSYSEDVCSSSCPRLDGVCQCEGTKPGGGTSKDPNNPSSPCFNVKCPEGTTRTVEGTKCICTSDTIISVPRCDYNTCSVKRDPGGNVVSYKCCPQGTYCGRTNASSDNEICVNIGGATGGGSDDCTTPNKTCGTTACTYCQEAGFTCTNTGYSLGGIAECSGKSDCADVTLKYSCYEQVPSPDNTRTVSISMGTNNISGSKVWTETQERTNFSSVNTDTSTQAVIQSWISSNKTIAIKTEEEETIINPISWLKNIVEKAFAAEPTYTTTTSQGYTNDNASGLELNNPTKVVASFTDTSGVNDLEGLFYWMTSEGTSPSKSPRYIDDSASLSTAKTVSGEDFGFMIRRGSDTDETDAWTDTSGLYVYIPAITTAGNYWIKAGSFGSDFYIYGPNGLKMVRIFNMVMSIPSSTKITLTFNIEFLNENSGISSYEKVTDGTYDVLEMAIDEYSFLTWNKYTIPTTQTTDGVGINPDTVRTYFSEHSIRDYREWTDTGLNWVVDLTKPNITQMLISTETYQTAEGVQTNLNINWDASDVGSGIAYVVENLFTEYAGGVENSIIKFDNSVKLGDSIIAETEPTDFTVPSYDQNYIGRLTSNAVFKADWRDSAKGVETYYGITKGLKGSTISFREDYFCGDDRNEVGISCIGGNNGCKINTVEGKVIYTPNIACGIAISDDATGSGFIMYSPVRLSTRGIYSRSSSNSYNYIAVRYNTDEDSWQYNDNVEWIDFSPIAGDILVATINFDGDPQYGISVVVDSLFQDIDLLGVDTLNISESKGSILYAYLTVFDEAGNFDILSDTYNTDSWLITRGGMVFSEGGTNINILLTSLKTREYKGISKGLSTSNISYTSVYKSSVKVKGFEMSCSDGYCTMKGVDGAYVKVGIYNSKTGVTTYKDIDGTVTSSSLMIDGVRMGISVTGSGFIMYSVDPLSRRLNKSGTGYMTSTFTNATVSDHFVIVRYNETSQEWEYNNYKGWIAFTPVISDILVTSVIFDPFATGSIAKIVTEASMAQDFDESLEEDSNSTFNFTFGLLSSNLVIEINKYAGTTSYCDVQIECSSADSSGCYLITPDGTEITDFSLGKGLTSPGIAPNCDGSETTFHRRQYIMYSVKPLSVVGINVASSASQNFFIARYYYEGTSAGQWFYNNNSKWIECTEEISNEGKDNFFIIGRISSYQQTSATPPIYGTQFKYEIVSADSWPVGLWYSPSYTSTDNDKSRIFDSSTADVSSEILAGNVKNIEDLFRLVHSTPLTTGGAYNESSSVLENIGIIKNSAYITYRARAKAQESTNQAVEYIPSTNTTFSGYASNYCKTSSGTAKYCVVDSQYDITIASGFSCDTKVLFMTSGDIDIEPSVTNANGTSACIFLAGGDITIGEGTYKSSGQTEPKYDYVEGFLIADGIINIKSGDAGKSVKDGLQINGGMVGFGGSAKSIVITRDMKLADKQLYPIVAVMADSRYGKTALTFFGAEFTVYKQEVGYKPY